VRNGPYRRIIRIVSLRMFETNSKTNKTGLDPSIADDYGLVPVVVRSSHNVLIRCVSTMISINIILKYC
jgi:hypothetical protein